MRLWWAVNAALALAVGCVSAAPPASGPAGRAVQASAPPQQVPDVTVLIFSGLAPVDQVVITYSGAVSGRAALADVNAFLSAGGVKAQRIGRPETIGAPKSTSVDLDVPGLANWNTGTLTIEPFIVAFKRFNRININYSVQGTFPFRGLRDYSDKYVSISWLAGAGAQNYDITIKDRSFNRLDLPLAVAPPAEPRKEKVEAENHGGGTKTWVALILAAAAGTVAFIIVSRVSRHERSG